MASLYADSASADDLHLLTVLPNRVICSGRTPVQGCDASRVPRRACLRLTLLFLTFSYRPAGIATIRHRPSTMLTPAVWACQMCNDIS